MKKFLLSLAAVAMVSGVASATTVYFENTENWSTVNAYCWSPENAKWPGAEVATTIEASGRTFYSYEVPGAQTSIIFNNGSDQTKDLKVVDGAVYSAANATSLDALGSIKDGVFTPAGEVVIEYATIYVPVSEWDYDNCYIYTWSPSIFGGWPGQKMSEVSVDGTSYWSIKVDKREIDGVTVGGWKLNNGNGEESANNETGTVFQDGYAYTLAGESYEVGQGGGEDPDPDPEALPLYIAGAISDWSTSAPYKMTADANGNYTIHLDKLSGEFKITTDIVANKWDDEHTYSCGEAMTLGQEYTCTVGGLANMSVEGLGATDVTINFNINTLAIKVTGTPVTEAVVKYFIKGNFVDPMWPATELVQDGDLYAATIIPKQAECEFIITKTVDDVEAAWYKGVEAVPGETATMLDNDGGNATATLKAGATYLFAFNPETLGLTVTMTSGVADIEAAEQLPAVYYNLQGVRVENPANGLFLEVRGNQVRKVAVK